MTDLGLCHRLLPSTLVLSKKRCIRIAPLLWKGIEKKMSGNAILGKRIYNAGRPFRVAPYWA